MVKSKFRFLASEGPNISPMHVALCTQGLNLVLANLLNASNLQKPVEIDITCYF